MDYYSGPGHVSGQFVDGVTTAGASYFNAVQSEVINAIVAAGIVPSASDVTQLAQAFRVASPAGIIAPYAGETAPAGWSICDGSPLSRTDDSALFAAIGTTYGAGDGSTTFNKPDLRGYFIRGWAGAGSLDAGRVLGSTQAGSPGDHTHIAIAVRDDANTGGTTRPSIVKTTASQAADVIDYNADNPLGMPVDAAAAPLASETRPANVAMLYIIKL